MAENTMLTSNIALTIFAANTADLCPIANKCLGGEESVYSQCQRLHAKLPQQIPLSQPILSFSQPFTVLALPSNKWEATFQPLDQPDVVNMAAANHLLSLDRLQYPGLQHFTLGSIADVEDFLDQRIASDVAAGQQITQLTLYLSANLTTIEAETFSNALPGLTQLNVYISHAHTQKVEVIHRGKNYFNILHSQHITLNSTALSQALLALYTGLHQEERQHITHLTLTLSAKLTVDELNTLNITLPGLTHVDVQLDKMASKDTLTGWGGITQSLKNLHYLSFKRL